MSIEVSDLITRLQDIHGIHIVPFREDGAIDEEALRANVVRLVDSGIRVIVTCGNTGEFYSLTMKETREVTRIAAEAAGHRATVVCGIGYDAVTAAEMGRYAEACGANALMLHQPVHPFQSAEGYFDYVQAVAAGTRLPILLYVKRALAPEWFPRLADIPSVIGVKYAINDLVAFAEAVLTEPKRLVWICGTAEMWAPFFMDAGATGWTSGLVNVAPKLSLTLKEAIQQGDKESVWRLWQAVLPFERLRARRSDGNNVSVVKEAMAQLGLAPRRVRPPICELPDEEKAEIHHIITTSFVPFIGGDHL